MAQNALAILETENYRNYAQNSMVSDLIALTLWLMNKDENRYEKQIAHMLEAGLIADCIISSRLFP